MERTNWRIKMAAELFSRLKTKEKVNNGINTIIEYLGQDNGEKVLRKVFEYAKSHKSKCKEFMQQYLSRREGGL